MLQAGRDRHICGTLSPFTQAGLARGLVDLDADGIWWRISFQSSGHLEAQQEPLRSPLSSLTLTKPRGQGRRGQVLLVTSPLHPQLLIASLKALG